MAIEWKTSNPTLKENTFEDAIERAAPGTAAMTMGGTMAKTGLLFMIFLTAGAIGWINPSYPTMIGGFIAAFVLALIVAFKPHTAPYLSPVYAIAKGVSVGALSVMFASAYQGIVPQAILITAGIFLAMLTLYSTGIIKVTPGFRGMVLGATLGIFIVYVATMVIGIFYKGIYELPMYQPGLIGVGFSLLVIGIAALNLALDFQSVRDGIEVGAPKYMEWYAGFGLLVTVVWIYIEVLQLLRKLQR